MNNTDNSITGRGAIQARISKPMSDAEIQSHIGIKPDDIIKYSELQNFKTIGELLPTDKSFKIILIEDRYNQGHWVCVMKYGKTIEYFNSYGAKWDTDWKFVNKMIRVILNESQNDMTRLMNQAEKDGWKTIWNKHRFQKLDNKIQTCGRWVTLRVEMMKMGYDLDEFARFIQRRKEETGDKSDFIVSQYVK
jgi:hypothetical protein